MCDRQKTPKCRDSKRSTLPFDPCDGGSLIVDNDNLGVALLFAGGDSGGSNGMGLTYANPLRTVLDALKIDLIF